ncbi:11506_t:CDS:2 [Ambispora leptoticha]|uniref:11506_t:CDS:1 n=1 Tax=Ambispora leptoticha TaxID=144679 RepID=A0A9N9A895_9GLOM|nr:11506_t:CDS:2 [Ambispora leptoticha]
MNKFVVPLQPSRRYPVPHLMPHAPSFMFESPSLFSDDVEPLGDLVPPLDNKIPLVPVKKSSLFVNNNHDNENTLCKRCHKDVIQIVEKRKQIDNRHKRYVFGEFHYESNEQGEEETLDFEVPVCMNYDEFKSVAQSTCNIPKIHEIMCKLVNGTGNVELVKIRNDNEWKNVIELLGDTTELNFWWT